MVVDCEKLKFARLNSLSNYPFVQAIHVLLGSLISLLQRIEVFLIGPAWTFPIFQMSPSDFHTRIFLYTSVFTRKICHAILLLSLTQG